MTIIKEHQLQILLNEFELISKNTLNQCEIAKKIMNEPDRDDLIEEAEQNEILIDRLEMKVREEVAFTIFKFSPMAEDLRRIISYLDIATNIERTADMILNIIYYIREVELDQPSLSEVRHILHEMMDRVSGMLRDAVLAYSEYDPNTAYDVIRRDDIVDEQYHALRGLLPALFSGRELQDKEVQLLLVIGSIAHNLERCGDSATNIAESVIYLAKGDDIRHQRHTKEDEKQ